jgi:hypothetical protein
LCSLATIQIACGSVFQSSTLPDTLSDRDFWSLASTLSEPAGSFTHSENLVSNEILFVHTVRRLRQTGGVYIGVGPEQNFSYLAKLRPPMAFIIDIRRENRNLHLLYKALFEMSLDRAEFVARLFSRERPAGLHATTSVQDLFAAYATVAPSQGLYEETLQSVRTRLADVHGFAVSPADVDSIAHALHAFYTDGVDIHYGRSLAKDAAGPSYRTLMTARDLVGQTRSYLSSEASFRFLKELQARNLIVPIVGDFAGAVAIRRTGDYIRQHHATVGAFYGSNVEVYLNRRMMSAYCGNLAALPYRSSTQFIDSKGMQTFTSKLRSCQQREK